MPWLHGEINTDDATGDGVAVTWYYEGTTDEKVITAADKLDILDAKLTHSAEGELKVVADSDDDGRRYIQVDLPAGGGIVTNQATKFVCPPCTVVRVITESAGDLKGTFEAFLNEA